MIRSFVAIALPEDIREAVVRIQSTLPLPRPLPPENLHLTLVFLGDVSEGPLEELHFALAALAAEPFDLSLQGVGLFGSAKPRVVFARVAESASLRRLQSRVEQAARGVGVTVERRRFTPHVALSYLKAMPRAEAERLERAAASAAAFASGPFRVEGFGLYRSDLGKVGARYSELAHYAF